MTQYETETLKQERIDELVSTFGISELDDQEKIMFLAKECIRLRTLYFEAYDTMKTKIDGHSGLKSAIGKRTVQQLSIANNHIPRITHDGHRSLEALAPRLFHQCLNI